MAVLERFHTLRGPDAVRLVDAEGVRSRIGGGGSGVIGGALLVEDLRIDPRSAAPGLAHWLAETGRAEIRYGARALRVEPGRVEASVGEITAAQILACVNHEVSGLFPEVAAARAVSSCTLQMLRVSCPRVGAVSPAVLSGFSMLRYAGFAETGLTDVVRVRLEREHPEALAAGLNLMLTQLPNGDLVLGDTHLYGASPNPFSSADWDELILDGAADLLGVSRRDLRVRERWLGVYAAAPDPFLIEEVAPGVRAVSVTTGIGMTTAFGLAEDVVAAF
jgi:FAD dependent oxidoreductase TIGR03364